MPATAPNPILDAALELLEHGYSIVPIRPDASKAPALTSWRHYTAQRATPDTVRGWFADGGHDLGVIQGAISGGAELTELEGRAAHRLPELQELAHASGLGRIWDAVTHGWVELSPGGGWHLHYRVTGMTVPGNQKLARNTAREVLAETRGEGGQVVAAPSRHHATGQPWRRIIGGPATTPTLTADERDALHDLIRTLDEQPEQPAPAPRAEPGMRRDDGRLKPGDDYEAKVDWADILQPHGWTHIHTQGRTRHWRRPGKTIGISATTGHAQDRDRLYVFSSSTPFEPETPYTKFGALSVLEHGGDHAAAASALARAGYGDRPQLAEVIEFTQHQTVAEAVTAVPGESPTVGAEDPPPTVGAEEKQTPTAAPADPLQQRIDDETARLLIQREARRRLEQIDHDTPPAPPAWIDTTPLLDGTYDPPQPTIGSQLTSGLPILYAAAVNGLIGDPEAAKTILATAIAVDELHRGGTVAWIDLDHNGAPATINRFRRFGASTETLADQARFRLALPEDAPELDALIHDLTTTPATLAIIDSIGELLPIYGASSNDADEYTRVHQAVMAKLARAGTAALTIDHLSKGTDSRNYGASGTIAKKRAYDGALLRVTIDQPFTPGNGGTSDIRIIKDRHGALRAAAAGGGREPLLARFTLTERENTATAWQLAEPGHGIGDAIADVDTLAELDPEPTSIRDIKNRLGWGSDRAHQALKTFRELRQNGAL